jgi:hypothetical protein
MMKKVSFFIALNVAVLILIMACSAETKSGLNTIANQIEKGINNTKPLLIDSTGVTINKRILTPQHCKRESFAANSFASYLRQLKLMPHGSLVKYYNGATKTKPNVYVAVIDLPIGTQDLHQCADAVMHVWSRYLFTQKQYQQMKFLFLGDSKWHVFSDWANNNYTEKNYWHWIQQVWSAANTKSLYKQMQSVELKDIQVGDVLLQTGNPYGHAIIIVDECKNIKTGKKYYLLAQSYMPAQQLQLLDNPAHLGNPWYSFDDTAIETPEWDFTINDFKRF